MTDDHQSPPRTGVRAGAISRELAEQLERIAELLRLPPDERPVPHSDDQPERYAARMEEGVRLMRAFRTIEAPAEREELVRLAEAFAQRAARPGHA